MKTCEKLFKKNALICNDSGVQHVSTYRSCGAECLKHDKSKAFLVASMRDFTMNRLHRQGQEFELSEKYLNGLATPICYGIIFLGKIYSLMFFHTSLKCAIIKVTYSVHWVWLG